MGSKSYGVGMADWVCDAPDHWAFAGTGMKKGDGIKDLVGWEYHGEPVGPQKGLVVLATSPIRDKPRPGPRRDGLRRPEGERRVQRGDVLVEHGPLDAAGVRQPAERDFAREDARVQRITKNLLDRMIRG